MYRLHFNICVDKSMIDFMFMSQELLFCSCFKLQLKFARFQITKRSAIISLVHYVAPGRVCVSNEFELEFGHQFEVTSANMTDVIHTMMDA